SPRSQAASPALRLVSPSSIKACGRNACRRRGGSSSAPGRRQGCSGWRTERGGSPKDSTPTWWYSIRWHDAGWMPVPSTCGRTTARTRGWRSWDGPPSPLPGAAWWPEAASRPTLNRGGGGSCRGALADRLERSGGHGAVEPAELAELGHPEQHPRGNGDREGPDAPALVLQPLRHRLGPLVGEPLGDLLHAAHGLAGRTLRSLALAALAGPAGDQPDASAATGGGEARQQRGPAAVRARLLQGFRHGHRIPPVRRSPYPYPPPGRLSAGPGCSLRPRAGPPRSEPCRPAPGP